MRGPVVTALVAAVLLTCGCQSARDGEVLGPKVEERLKDGGFSPDSVTCPTLPRKKGSQITCTFTQDGREYDAIVTSYGKNNRDILFDVEVPDGP